MVNVEIDWYALYKIFHAYVHNNKQIYISEMIIFNIYLYALPPPPPHQLANMLQSF